MTSMQIVQLIFKGLFSSNTLLFQVNQPLFQLTFFSPMSFATESEYLPTFFFSSKCSCCS